LKPGCIIFDFDGTIADTSPGIFNSIRYAANKLNLRELSVEELKLHLGPPIREAYNRSFGITGEKLEQAIELHKEYSLSTGYREFEFYPEMLNVLLELRKRGFKMGIATSKPDVIIKKIVQVNNLEEFFDVVCGTICSESKTEVIEKCLKNLPGCNDITVIGDSVFDQMAAKTFGLKFIGVTYGYGFVKNDTCECKSSVIIPTEILNFFNKIPNL